jgi:hypothetical protein
MAWLLHKHPRIRAPSTHWIGGWVGPRSGLDAVVERKIPCSHQELKPGHPTHSLDTKLTELLWLFTYEWREPEVNYI